MPDKPKAIFCWSSGKDSALCLSRVLEEGQFEVCYLLTTVNDTFNRISMHGVREELLDLQAASIGIPLLKVRVSEGTNEEYERQMELTLARVKSEGIEHVIFGDIFLEDLREYRERNLAMIGMKAVFPLWKLNTGDLIRAFIDSQFEAIVCCTNDAFLGEDWLGRKIDLSFLSDLPGNVDPCGENGEFHTFCFAGPVFKEPICFSLGERIFRPLELKSVEVSSQQQVPVTRGFWYCDLLPVR
ncbi:MAG: diphthine--ammonia ligase [Bacteroidales bacterium]|jgi:uncharacterized protein (TIGR00290 family)